MSSASVNTEVAAASPQQIGQRASHATPTNQKATGDNTAPRVKVETSLREPIRSIAEKTNSEKAHTLSSIENVAEDIEEAIEALNDALAKAPTKATISHDDQLNRYIVKIADERSGEVIREIPSEAVLKFARNLQEIKGLLFDKAL